MESMSDERKYLDLAKQKLRDQLANHPDEGVRLLAEATELSDDHPAVRRIALAMLEADEAKDSNTIGFGE
jgi:hypothetical protein